MFDQGYATVSARRHIRSAEHIICWANGRNLSLLEIRDSALHRFENHLDHCSCGRYLRCDHADVLAGVRVFLGYVQGVDQGGSRARQTVVEPQLWNAFCGWMTAQRGTSEQDS